MAPKSQNEKKTQAPNDFFGAKTWRHEWLTSGATRWLGPDGPDPKKNVSGTCYANEGPAHPKKPARGGFRGSHWRASPAFAKEVNELPSGSGPSVPSHWAAPEQAKATPMEKPQHRGRREVPSTIPLRATGGERYPNRNVEKTFGASEKTLKKSCLAPVKTR